MASKCLPVREMFLLWYSIMCLGVTCVADGTCYSPVHLELGKTGTIQCSFSDGFYSLYWYNVPDIFGETPILTYDESGRGGPGYSSEEFDIHPNGSLIIRNVSIEHETTFTVTKFQTPTKPPQHHQVMVNTIVKPSRRQPVVLSCESWLDSCYIEWTQSINVSCQIEHSRPAINITWYLRSTSSDEKVPSRHKSSNDSTTHTTDMMLQGPFIYQTNLSLHVCKADDPIGLLEKKETAVLLEKMNIDWSLVPVFNIFRERYTDVNFLCTQTSPHIIVWKKGESANSMVTMAYDAPSENNFRSPMPEGWEMKANSSLLTLQRITNHDGGVYACHSYDGKTEAFDVYKLEVIVYPSPAYPVIEGCSHDRYCVLENSPNDTITCAVRGIRPGVDLKLQSFPPGSSEVSIIDPRQITVWVNDELIDVILTARLGCRDVTSTRRTLECIVTGENASMFTKLSTKFDVILTDSIESTKTPIVNQSEIQRPWTFVIGFSVVFVCLACCGLLISVYRNWLTKRRQEMARKDEVVELEDVTTPLMPKDKSMFIEQLKTTYGILCSSLRPIPYFKHQVYPVNALFLDVGIDHLVTDKRSEWEHLQSCTDVGVNFQAASRISVIEGDPGYGKTTLTLQLAYEWCQNIPGTLLESTEILVLLRLRQLVNCADIFDVIMLYILPNEINSTRQDIKRFLASSTVVIILDGFDEFPESDRVLQSILSDMIKTQNTPRFHIILTTRSLQLPKEIPSNAARFKLCGFNSEARDQYLRKMTQENSLKAMDIKKLLQDDPIICDICQVPLFFVLYVHLRAEGGIDKPFSSITSFFRHIVSCLHMHHRNKTDVGNVKKAQLSEDDHKELDKLSFDAMISGGKRNFEKEVLLNKLSDQFVEHYVEVGILQEAEHTTIDDTPGVLASEHIRTEHIVTFHHGVYFEWYAAHYVAAILSSKSTQNAENGSEILDDIDEHRFPYLYRFVCGINPDAAEHILYHLKTTGGGDELATMCLLEQKGDVEKIIGIIGELCSKELVLSPSKSRLVNRSTVQMMELASSNNVGIKCLSLNESIGDADEESDEIILGNDLRLPILQTLHSMWVNKSEDIRGSDVMNILKYAKKCKSVQEITFSRCILPFSIEDETAASIIREGIIRVSWYTTAGVGYDLDAESGRWKNKNGGAELGENFYKKEVEEFKEMYPE